MAKKNVYHLPILVEKDEKGFYVVECPVFEGCYTEGKSLDEALENIKQVLDLVLEEENRRLLKTYKAEEFSLHTVLVKLRV